QCSKSNVTFTVTATNNCDGTNVTIVCAPPSGSTFNVGTNTVTCIATDSSTNTNSCSFLITVRDMDPPNIICPGNLVLTAGTNLCVAVNFAPTISNNCGLLT